MRKKRKAMSDYSLTPELNDEDIKQRLNALLSTELKEPRKEVLKNILGLIDLTTLEGSDTDQKVIDMCNKAKGYRDMGLGLPNTAAVCVYPTLIRAARKTLVGTDIHIASVAGAFPAGQSPIHVKMAEVEFAVDEGADEIDIVISRGKYLEGEYNQVYDEIAALKDVCGQVHLKVILETGELLTATHIRRASEIAMHAGADFIKTSTGKISPAATEFAMLVMLDAINDFQAKTGKVVGIKPAGGISEPDVAINYYKLTQLVLGEKWLNKDWFRFGASRLADKLVEQIKA